MRPLLLLAVALIIAGCATPFRPWNLSEIREGMARRQVETVLGSPDYTETKDGADYLHYIYQEDYNPMSTANAFPDMDNDRAFKDLNSERIFKKYEYVVILVDGKVINYKEL